MTERAPSHTAVGVAILRAVHQILDAEPRILEDPVALRIVEPAALETVRREHLERFREPGAAALRSHMVLRSRFAEDRLADAVGRGIRQYVVLGAGYDTFAYRQPSWARELAIYEVDHPASQEAKRARLAAAGIDVPGNVRLVAIDFDREPLAEGLARGGVNPRRPAFFSWLGVMMYLPRAAVDSVFRTVASYPGGSEIVYSFARPEGPGESGRPTLADRAAALGEPWLTRLEPAELERLLLEVGFSRVSFLDPGEAYRRYYADRVDTLPPPRRSSIGAALV